MTVSICARAPAAVGVSLRFSLLKWPQCTYGSRTYICYVRGDCLGNEVTATMRESMLSSSRLSHLCLCLPAACFN